MIPFGNVVELNFDVRYLTSFDVTTTITEPENDDHGFGIHSRGERHDDDK
jgi:hypothetical protein